MGRKILLVLIANVFWLPLYAGMDTHHSKHHCKHHLWKCEIKKGNHVYIGHGKKMNDAMQMVEHKCMKANGSHMCKKLKPMCHKIHKHHHRHHHHHHHNKNVTPKTTATTTNMPEDQTKQNIQQPMDQQPEMQTTNKSGM